MSTSNGSSDFKLTDDEMERFKKAMESKEFRDLFMDYAKEISDPENKKRYEEDIIAMEKERGQDVKLITPQPGFVIKTRRLSDQKKVFINVCSSDVLQECTTENTTQNGKTGVHISLPHCFSPKRADLDKGSNHCDVYDVCFHPLSLQKADKNTRFRTVLLDTIFDGLKEKLNEHVERKNIKYPKMKFKGIPQATIIRKQAMEDESHKAKDSNHSDNTECQTERAESDASSKIIPTHKMVHRGYFDMQSFTSDSKENGHNKPKELVVTIETPEITSASELDVDIFENRIVLESKIYSLDLPLKCTVNEDEAKAQFDTGSRTLTITLPLIKGKEEQLEQKLVTEMETFDGDNLDSDNASDNVEPDSICDDSKLVDSLDNAVKNHSLDDCTSSTDKILCDDTIRESIISNPSLDDRTSIYDVEKTSEGTSSTQEKNLTNQSSQSCSMLPDNKNNTNDDDTKDIIKDDEKLLERTTSEIHESFTVLSLNDTHIPPYTITQNDESVWIDIGVKNVSVIDISVGFATNEMNISFPCDDVNNDSWEWSLFIRFLDNNLVNVKECGLDVSIESLKVRLKKQQSRLWKAVYVGATEKKLEFVGLEEGVEKPETASNNESKYIPSVLSMEGRLQQLLNEQEQAENLSYICKEEESSDEEECLDPREKNVDDGLHVKLDLLDLQDDVIDELSPLASPNEKKSRFQVRPILERSLSHDYVQHPRLKSILKRSRSYSGNYDGDDYIRMRNLTMSADDCYYTSTDEESSMRRSRNKSVSFSDTPIVFEFQKLSKRQWKKQLRKQNGDSNSDSTGSNEQNISKGNKKKKKKAEKKRNRNNSESRSEEENENMEHASKKQRKKKKKKNANNNILQNNASAKDPTKTPVLNNPLIFELD